MPHSISSIRIAALALATASLTSIVQPQTAAAEDVFGPVLISQPRSEPKQADSDRSNEASPNWIGLLCHAASPELRSQFGLSEEQGLVVDNVVASSPAQKAGLQRHDVLISVDGQSLGDARQLSVAVNRQAEGPMKLKVLRRGKRFEANVAPSARPENPPTAPALPQADQRTVRRWVERLRQRAAETGTLPGEPLRMRFLNPGILSSPQPEPFPEDLRVTITRDGKKPLEVEVKQGDQEWKLTSDQVAELPEPIQEHVRRMVDGAMGTTPIMNFRISDFLPQAEADGEGGKSSNTLLPEIFVPGLKEPSANSNSTDADPQDRAIDDLNQQLQLMQEKLREIRTQRRQRRDSRLQDRNRPATDDK